MQVGIGVIPNIIAALDSFRFAVIPPIAITLAVRAMIAANIVSYLMAQGG